MGTCSALKDVAAVYSFQHARSKPIVENVRTCFAGQGGNEG